MIVLKDDNIIEIPNYDDLDNKPKINGVVLEGNKTTTQLGLNVDLSGFYTKTQSDDRFQPKGNYLTSVPSNYVTESELNNTLNQKDYATKSEIPVIPSNVSSFNNDAGYITENALNGYATESYVDNAIDNAEVNLTGYATEQWVGENYQVKGDYQPAGNYLTSIPSEYVTDGELSAKNYATKSEIPVIPSNVSYFNNDSGYITNSALAGYATETYVSDNYQPKGNYQPAGNYLTSIPSEYITEGELNDALAAQLNSKQDTLVSGTNIKTINGNSILGSGDLTITGGTTDLSNYYTKTEIDNKIGDVNTILENIIG